MLERMPTSGPSTIFCEDHRGSDLAQRRFDVFGVPFNRHMWKMVFAKEKYLLLVEICLNEYWNDLMIVSQRHDLSNLVVFRAKIKRIVAGKWDLDARQLFRYTLNASHRVVKRFRT